MNSYESHQKYYSLGTARELQRMMETGEYDKANQGQNQTTVAQQIAAQQEGHLLDLTDMSNIDQIKEMQLAILNSNTAETMSCSSQGKFGFGRSKNNNQSSLDNELLTLTQAGKRDSKDLANIKTFIKK